MGGCSNDCMRYSNYCKECGNRMCNYRYCYSGNVSQSEEDPNFCTECIVAVQEKRTKRDNLIRKLTLHRGEVLTQELIDKLIAEL